MVQSSAGGSSSANGPNILAAVSLPLHGPQTRADPDRTDKQTPS